MSNIWMNRLAAVTATALLAGCGGGAPPAEKPKAAEKPAAAPAAPATEPAPAEGAAVSYEVTPVADGGAISGKVMLGGTAPAPEIIEVTKDGNVCGTEKKTEKYMVSTEGALANAVVWIDGIAKGKDWPAGEAVVDQKDCHYVPHVQAVPAGKTVEIINSDAVLHNVHAYAGGETLFNLAQPTQGQKTPKKLNQTGPIELKCDVHSWMHAWVFVAPNPYYAVTADDGTFKIGDVPPGTYKVKVWHESAGEQSAEVVVAAAGAHESNFTLTAP